jgi:hypothetical protein
MAEPASKADGATQINGIYQALGRFTVEFSRMVDAMETDLYFTIGGNQLLLRSITAELTADPLRRAWRSIMTQATELSPRDLDVLAKLAYEISEVINLRNDWAHGTWFVGFGSEEVQSQASLMRFKNSAKGLARPSQLESTPTAAYIEQAATHANVIARAVQMFGATVHMRQTTDTKVRPSDRVRITKKDGHSEIQVSRNGVDWVATEWPLPLSSTSPGD